ncbi:MAG: histidinol-phosphatase HisJ family protein [Bacillota bacterium]
MSYLADYHVHTNNSFDSVVSMDAYCRKAIEIGLQEVVFTEHFDLNPLDEGLGLFDFSKYSQEIEQCRQRYAKSLVIKKGLELGEPHLYLEEHEKLIANKDFDFLIGSVHYIGEFLLHRDYGDEDEQQVYLDYFQEVLEAARKGKFHVLGHIDVLKRYVPRHFQKFKAEDYREIMREILKAAIDSGKGIEINTSGYRQGLGEPLPTIEVIKMYKEQGGEIVTLGSDAHHLEHLGQDLGRGINILKSLDFKGIWVFEKGVPKQIPF